jgi:hypothetical protein
LLLPCCATRRSAPPPRPAGRGLAPRLANPADGVAGFHFYTFNEVARTERWRQQALARLTASV